MKKTLFMFLILLSAILCACANDVESSVPVIDMPSNTEITTVNPVTEYRIENFECIYQSPELSTGCEITAMDMVLNYYGFDIDKVTLANEYMPTISYDTYHNDENVTDKSDMNNYFIGDPETVWGYIAGTGAIQIATNDYLADVNNKKKAYDITGEPVSELYKYVENDIPVVVWVTINMVDRTDIRYYYVDDDTYIEWTMDDHGAVLIGYDDTTVTLADPINGIMEYDRTQFESVFESRENMAVVVK